MERSPAELSRCIIGAAITVHRALGPGLLESIYESCLIAELRHQGLFVERQVRVPVLYRGQDVNCDFVIDLIVEGCIVVEIKAISQIAPVHEAQVLTYLKITGLKIGLLLNFNVPLLKEGVRRIVNGEGAGLVEHPDEERNF